ncbi:hypothetical protein, partial [Mesorhizobium sp. M4B.F.Ca.ET.169.01.1.1]|uniref:hypothetical protein n=1 Tax=Mesorhizobium sp. M4B.F.Ca.ET.169.01.1.1 TaxID=2563949 RepID=UPI001AEEF055
MDSDFRGDSMNKNKPFAGNARPLAPRNPVRDKPRWISMTQAGSGMFATALDELGAVLART